MGTVKTGARARDFGDLVATCRIFADWHGALRACDPETQADLEGLLADINSEDIDEFERESLLATITQALLPGLDPELAPGEVDDSWATPSADEMAANHTLNAEEATFARKLSEAMKAKGMTQTALAAAIGIGQPAISMILARDCRPQRRTVEKIARALGVAPRDLWPSKVGCVASSTTH